MQVYQILSEFCAEVAASWRKTQRVNLALAMQALLQRRTLTLSHLAQAFPAAPLPAAEASETTECKHSLWHRLKRLRRFLGNPRLAHTALMQRCLQLGLCVSDEPGLRLSLLMDLTYLEPYAFFVISIPKLGRALPVAWHAFRRDLQGEKVFSQNQLLDGLLTQVLGWLSPRLQPVVVADREFARASLLRLLVEQGKDFVIRIDRGTWVGHATFSGVLTALPMAPGQRPSWLAGALYAQHERIPINLLVLWRKGQDEPWILATSLSDPDEVAQIYASRMKIEHGFRDWKSHLRLKGTLKAQNVAYVKGLLSVLALVYWCVGLFGLQWLERRYWSRAACWGQPGFFKVALDLLTAGDSCIQTTWATLKAWLHDKLFVLRPLPPPYLLRYRRNRPSLHQTG